jgi:hypothetical protein
MPIYDVTGKIIETGGGNSDGLIVNTDAYKSNFSNVFAEKFQSSNSDFTFTNCAPGSNGLSCHGFCKATYKKGVILNDGKACMSFRYTEDVVIGLFLTMSLAYVDTQKKVIGLIFNYNQGSTIETSSTQNINFDFISGHEYELVLERNFWDVTATIKDITESVEKSVSSQYYIGNSAVIVNGNLSTVGVAVYSGSTTVGNLSYWLPFYGKHLKVLVLGDSITEGIADAKTSGTCWSRRLLFEHFHSNGVTCGVGATSPSVGIDRFKEMIQMGYMFDYVISYLCTNDTCNDSQIPQKQIAYQGYVDEIKSTGAKCVWCMLPEYISGSPSNSNKNLRTVMSSLTGLEALVDFGLVLDTSEPTHPSVQGQTNMFKLVDATLELSGI